MITRLDEQKPRVRVMRCLSRDNLVEKLQVERERLLRQLDKLKFHEYKQIIKQIIRLPKFLGADRE